MKVNEKNHYEKINDIDDACRVLIGLLKEQDLIGKVVIYEDYYLKVFKEPEENELS